MGPFCEREMDHHAEHVIMGQRSKMVVFPKGRGWKMKASTWWSNYSWGADQTQRYYEYACSTTSYSILVAYTTHGQPSLMNISHLNSVFSSKVYKPFATEQRKKRKKKIINNNVTRGWLNFAIKFRPSIWKGENNKICICIYV